MTAASVLGPFRPGAGAMPPYLAGRGAEQRLLGALLRDLEAGTPPAGDVILYGPRGNGKTVLLNWLRDEAAAASRTETVAILPSGVPDSERLSELLAPTGWWDRLTPEEMAFAGFSWRPGKPGGNRPPPLEEILAARARKSPLLVLLDEAHTLDLQVGRALLAASQEVRRKLPCLLVLAGTPNLQSRLASMDASFWSRSRQLRIGPLDRAATGEALRRPFDREGIPVPSNLLEEMARESQGYPFFVQLLGEAVWRHATAPKGSGAVTPAALAAARRGFDTVRGEYYVQRFDELARRRLLPVGRAVAEAFRDRQVLDHAHLEDAIRSGLGGTPEPGALDRAAEALRDLGYVWRVRASPEWEPGIPSLMEFVRASAPSP